MLWTDVGSRLAHHLHDKQRDETTRRKGSNETLERIIVCRIDSRPKLHSCVTLTIDQFLAHIFKNTCWEEINSPVSVLCFVHLMSRMLHFQISSLTRRTMSSNAKSEPKEEEKEKIRRKGKASIDHPKGYSLSFLIGLLLLLLYLTFFGISF